MHINQLRLINYRNYKDVSPTFSPGINIIYGDNAQGKTNLLESVFFMCRGYSHRSKSAKDLVQFGQDTLFLASDFTSSQTRHNLALKIQGGKKGWKLDKTAIPSFNKVQPYVGSIIFEPDDLDIVKAGPEVRRRFINQEISGLIPGYKEVLKTYERIRNQRNALLRQAKLKGTPLSSVKEAITPWDQQFLQAGSKIMWTRNNYLNRLTQKASPFHQGLAGKTEDLSITYQSGVFGEEFPETKEALFSEYTEKLSGSLEEDLERGYTKLGPHSDDLLVQINDHPARTFASQGQQRTAAISLKLAHIELYKENLGLTPIVLLDDILSELDDSRQKNILSVLENTQTFITCTNPSFSNSLSKDIHKLYVQDGVIYPG